MPAALACALAGAVAAVSAPASSAAASRTGAGGVTAAQAAVGYGPIVNADHDLTLSYWSTLYTTTVTYNGHGTLDLGAGGSYQTASTESPPGAWPPVGMTGNTRYRFRVSALIPSDLQGVYVAIEWTDSGGNAVGTDPVAPGFDASKPGWQTRDAVGVSPPTCTGAYLIFEILATASHIYVGQADLQQEYAVPLGAAVITESLAGAISIGSSA